MPINLEVPNEPTGKKRSSSADRLREIAVSTKGKAKKNPKRTYGIIACIAIFLLIIILVAALAGGDKEESASLKAAKAELEMVDQRIYDSKEKALRLNEETLPASSAKMLSSAIGIKEVVLVDVSTVNSVRDIIKGISGISDILPDEIKKMILQSITNKVYTARMFGILGIRETMCSIVLFFKPNEVKFNEDTIQFAISCAISPSWKPAEYIPALQATLDPWISEFEFQANGTLSFSTTAYEATEPNKIPSFVAGGLNIFAMVQKIKVDAHLPIMNNIESVLDRPLTSMPPFRLQLSLPFNESADGSFWTLSEEIPSRGKLWLPAAGIGVSGGTGFRINTSDLTVYVEGLGTEPSTMMFAAALTLNFDKTSQMQGTLEVAAKGFWDFAYQRLQLSGFLKGKWSPLKTNEITLDDFKIDFFLNTGPVPRSPPSPLKYRYDRRCGPDYFAPGANPGQCNPFNLDISCCNTRTGFCVPSEQCDAVSGIDYANDVGHKKPESKLTWTEGSRRCGIGFPAPGADIGQCNPYVNNNFGPCCKPFMENCQDENGNNIGSCGGFCGNDAAHCECVGCIDYSKVDSNFAQIRHLAPNFREDERCGVGFPAPSAEVGRCNTFSGSGPPGPCCSATGYCGNTTEHCNCDSCVDYSKQRLAEGVHVMYNIWNTNPDLCSQPSGSLTIYHGVVDCPNGEVRWDRIKTVGSVGPDGVECEWDTNIEKNYDPIFVDKYFGSCDKQPEAVKQFITSTNPQLIDGTYDPSHPPPPITEAPKLLKYRDDGRCGSNFPAPGAAIGQCNPFFDQDSLGPCCSIHGYCGDGKEYCEPEGSIDYSKAQSFMSVGASVRLVLETKNPILGLENGESGFSIYRGTICDNGNIQWNNFTTVILDSGTNKTQIKKQQVRATGLLSETQNLLLFGSCNIAPVGVPEINSIHPQQIEGRVDESAVLRHFWIEFSAKGIIQYSSRSSKYETFGVITSKDISVSVSQAPLGDLINLIKELVPSTQDNIIAALNNNLDLEVTGIVDFVLSTFDTPQVLNGRQCFKGLNIFIDDVGVKEGGFNGQVDIETIKKLSNGLKVQFDLQLYLPIYGGSKPWYFSVSAKDLVIPKFSTKIHYFSFILQETISGWTSHIEASLEVQPIPSEKPVSFFAEVNYDQSNKVLTFNGNVQRLTSIWGMPWLKIHDMNITAVINFPPDVPITYDCQLTALVGFTFSSDNSRTLKMNAQFASDNKIMFKTNINIGEIIPAVSQSIDTDVDIYISTHSFTEPNTLRSIPKGLSLFDSKNGRVKPGGFNGLTDSLSDGNGMDVSSLFAQFNTADDKTTLDLDLNFTEVKFGTNTKLTNVSFKLSSNAYRIWFGSVYVHAILVMAPSLSDQISLIVDGEFNQRDSGKLTGVVPDWNKPFGFNWINVVDTAGRLIVKDGAILSMKSSINLGLNKTKYTAKISACGLINDNGAAMAIDGINIGDIGSLICEIFKVCQFETIFKWIGVDNLELGITASTADFTENDWNGRVPIGMPPTTLCMPKYGPPKAGLTVNGITDFKGELKDILCRIVKDCDIVDSIWNLGLNLPFYHAESNSRHAKVMRRSHYDELIRPQSLDTINKFNVQFEKYNLSIPVFDWFTITGAGVIGQPFQTPPDFRAFLEFRVELESNAHPLNFMIAGTVTPIGTVSLAGSMTSSGWIDPFGIKGLIVKGVATEVGFNAATVIDKFGLGFHIEWGTVHVYFSGEISVTQVAGSYVRGCVAPKPENSNYNCFTPGANGEELTLRDITLGLTEMSSGAVNIPDSYVPGPDILSLSHLRFLVAAQSGIDSLGNKYQKGFYFDAKLQLFGVDVDVSVGAISRNVGFAIPITDLVFDLTLNFEKLTELLVTWLNKFVPFGGDILSSFASNICDLACIHFIAIQNFSSIDTVSLEKLPAFTMKYSLLGKENTVGPITLNMVDLKMSAGAFFDSVRKFFDLDFCLTRFGCDGGERCDRFVCKKSRRRLSDTETEIEAGHKFNFNASVMIDTKMRQFINTEVPSEATIYLRDCDTNYEAWLNHSDPATLHDKSFYNAQGILWYEQDNINIYDPVTYTRAQLRRQLSSCAPPYVIIAVAQKLKETLHNAYITKLEMEQFAALHQEYIAELSQ